MVLIGRRISTPGTHFALIVGRGQNTSASKGARLQYQRVRALGRHANRDGLIRARLGALVSSALAPRFESSQHAREKFDGVGEIPNLHNGRVPHARIASEGVCDVGRGDFGQVGPDQHDVRWIRGSAPQRGHPV